MKQETKDVKTGKPLKTVGQVDVPIYESTDELIASEDEERILTMFNNANRVRIMGNERAKHQLKSVGKNKRFELGYELLTDDELRECVSSIETLKAKINSQELQDRIDAYIAENDDSVPEEATEEETETIE
ncbi:hypothetical protein LCGC14_2121780 [marine sediment metagenome]|uniref:Uncharacterized protein n=1 Tax=marine sediment metagenome TaxID=412755 RepID=A0A0F9GH79_9ZZZZ